MSMFRRINPLDRINEEPDELALEAYRLIRDAAKLANGLPLGRIPVNQVVLIGAISDMAAARLALATYLRDYRKP